MMVRNMPKISIIMPIFNTGEQLYKTLMSVLSQKERDYEVIMVDDGSKDKLTLEIEQTFARFDSRFKLFVQESNKGPAISRNIGIQHANGKYVIFLDSDDLFCDDMLEEMASTLESSNADICISNFMMLDIVNNIKSPIYAKQQPGVTDRVFSLKELPESGLGFWMPMQGNKMLSRSFILKNDLYYQNLSNCDDLYFGYMSTIKAEKIVFCRKTEPLFIYRVNNKSQISYNVDSRNYVKAYELLFESIDTADDKVVSQLLYDLNNSIDNMISRCPNQEYNTECRARAQVLIRKYTNMR